MDLRYVVLENGVRFPYVQLNGPLGLLQANNYYTSASLEDNFNILGMQPDDVMRFGNDLSYSRIFTEQMPRKNAQLDDGTPISYVEFLDDGSGDARNRGIFYTDPAASNVYLNYAAHWLDGSNAILDGRSEIRTFTVPGEHTEDMFLSYAELNAMGDDPPYTSYSVSELAIGERSYSGSLPTDKLIAGSSPVYTRGNVHSMRFFVRGISNNGILDGDLTLVVFAKVIDAPNLLGQPMNGWFCVYKGDSPVDRLNIRGAVTEMDPTTRFNPRLHSNGVGIYPMNQNQVHNLFMNLWNSSLASGIQNKLYSDPYQAIISLRWYYGIQEDITLADSLANVTIGDYQLNGSAGAPALTARPSIYEFAEHDCGTIDVPATHNNFVDYSPYTQLEMYIPYVGFIQLDPNDCMGRQLNLKYSINLVTGGAIATVYVGSAGNWRVTAQASCVYGMDIPVQANARESITQSLLSLVSSGVGGMAAGPAGALIGGAASEFVTGGHPTQRSAGVTDESGSLTDFTPFLLISTPPLVTGLTTNLAGAMGYEDARTGVVRDLVSSGYFKVRQIYNGSQGRIPKDAYDEIETLLKSGVYR